MKNKIRKEILGLRKAISFELQESKSRIINHKVMNHPAYQKSELVFAYIDAKGEVKTRDVIEDSWKNGKKVAVPRVHGDIMKFYYISSYEDLEAGSFGLLEPKLICEEVKDVSKESIVIVPGVAFDRKGNRIGYGKGYYDKYFVYHPDIYKTAIAFSLQIVPEIPVDEFDIKMDCVITEDEIILNKC